MHSALYTLPQAGLRLTIDLPCFCSPPDLISDHRTKLLQKTWEPFHTFLETRKNGTDPDALATRLTANLADTGISLDQLPLGWKWPISQFLLMLWNTVCSLASQRPLPMYRQLLEYLSVCNNSAIAAPMIENSMEEDDLNRFREMMRDLHELQDLAEA